MRSDAVRDVCVAERRMRGNDDDDDVETQRLFFLPVCVTA